MVTPGSFSTIACPTYPEIRLALFPSSKVANMLDTFCYDVAIGASKLSSPQVW